MRRSRFSEARIIGIPREHRAGMGAPDPCREPGIGDAPFCTRRRNHGGTDVSDARRRKALGAGTARPGKMLAERMMDVAAPEAMPGKDVRGPAHGGRLWTGR